MMSLFSQPKGSRPNKRCSSDWWLQSNQTAGFVNHFFFSKTTSGGMESRAAREGDYVISIQLCESCESEDWGWGQERRGEDLIAPERFSYTQPVLPSPLSHGQHFRLMSLTLWTGHCIAQKRSPKNPPSSWLYSLCRDKTEKASPLRRVERILSL